MDAHTLDDRHVHDDEFPGPRIERSDTGTRVALSILFGVIWSLVESALFVIVVFGLIWSLITREPPPLRLRQFSNRLVSYSYWVWRYLTQNDASVPFPFSDFPEARDEPFDLGADTAPEVHTEV
jgi:hypothetical protein